MSIAFHHPGVGFELDQERLALREEAIAGLSGSRKSLPCKLFYDDVGSALFERICKLPEYYPTRTEVQIMGSCGRELAELVGAGATVIEYGSGSSVKTRHLLDALEAPAVYMPIEISRAQLYASAGAIARDYPGLEVRPVCADYTRPLSLPLAGRQEGRRVLYFPGSTIGNFEPAEARTFLRQMGVVAGTGGRLLIGVDLKKDPQRLHAAYNDASGVTAAFNRNVLARLNRELGADFDLRHFAHYAFYEPVLGRIEMHLVSEERQVVHIGSTEIGIEEGESIHTESSYKYTLGGFAELAAGAGWKVVKVFTDAQRQFSVQYLSRIERWDA